MVFALFIFAALLGMTSCWLFDRILKFQYQNYRDVWEEQGKSAGYFWFPPEEKSLSNYINRNVGTLSWTYFNDEWMNKEAKILQLVRFYRISAFMSLGIGVIAGLLIFTK